MNRTRNKLLTFLTLIFVSITSAAQKEVADTTHLTQYPYIFFLDRSQKDSITDETFYNSSQKIIFPVNKFALPQDSAAVNELKKEIFPLINQGNFETKSLMIRGAASPEGPYNFNKSLSDKRKQSVIDFFNSNLNQQLTSDQLIQEAIPEDYHALCIMMEKAQDTDYQLVRELCDKYLPEDNVKALKSALQKANGGKLWKRILKDYFPELRATRFVIFLNKPEEPVDVAELVKKEEAIPEQDSIEYEPTTEQPEPVIDRLPRRELLSVKSNLLLDVAYVPGYDRWCPIPNVAIEYYPLHGHFTYGASLDFPWWQDYWNNKYFQIRNYQVEARYYLRSGDINDNTPSEGAAFKGWYAQAYAHVGLFGICFDANRGWEGEGAGGGVGLGYVMPLGKKGHWRLEFGAQFGFFRCKYDPYQFECPVDPSEQDHLYYYKWVLDADLFKKRQYRYNWLGPTRIGITLTYDLLYRRINKKGASLRNWERP